MTSPDPFFIRSLTADLAAHYALQDGPENIPHTLQKRLRERQAGNGRKASHRRDNYIELEAQEPSQGGLQAVLPELFGAVQSREIRVVPAAFNSTPHFISHFQRAASTTLEEKCPAPLEIDKALRNRHFKSTDPEKASLWTSTKEKRLHGWETLHLGASIHRFVKEEMRTAVPKADNVGISEAEAADGLLDNDHYFYVWHPNGVWYTEFEKCQRQDPLGPAFGGYCSNLTSLCLRMRSDREALSAESSRGRDAVFHLLIPAYYPLIMPQPIAFSEELFPLVIKGSRLAEFEAPLVWLSMPEVPERLSLDGIGILPETVSSVFFEAVSFGLIISLLAGFSWVVYRWIVPSWHPAVGIMLTAFLCSALVVFFANGMGSSSSKSGSASKPQLLGEGIFLGLASEDENAA